MTANKPCNLLRKYERLNALCQLIINTRINQVQQNEARKQLLNCALFKKCKKEGMFAEQDETIKAASEYYAAPMATANNEYHVSLGKGNNFAIEDESQYEHASASLGLYSKIMPSNRYA